MGLKAMNYEANFTIINADFTTNIDSGAIPTRQFKFFCAHVIWSGLTGTINATVSVEGSNDGINWDPLASAVAISGANGNDLVLLSNVYCGYIRILATKNGVTGGNLRVIGTFKE